MTRGFNAAQRAHDAASPDEYVEVICVECDEVIHDFVAGDLPRKIQAFFAEHGDGPHLCDECYDERTGTMGELP